jgi:pullulanase/glycogen debranching enzyme
MVRALDGAGLEVLLDVVYNHTAAGNEHGPTLCHRGLDNAGYYRLVPGDPAHYFDTTGTGNSLDLSDPVCLRMVLDSLRYWATVMHVDGFRFDLAARRRPAHPRQRLVGAGRLRPPRCRPPCGLAGRVGHLRPAADRSGHRR